MRMTQESVIEKLVSLYTEENADYPKLALKGIETYFNSLPKSTSTKDPERLNGKTVMVSKLRKALTEKVGPLDYPGATKLAQKQFNKMDIEEQLKFQKQSRVARENTWVWPLEILPKNIEAIELSPEEKEANVQRAMARSKALLTEDVDEVNPNELMEKLLPYLKSDNIWDKSTALLLATGRRTFEIFKKAQFHLDNEMTLDGYRCDFEGQAKPGLFAPKTIEIPLLAPYKLIKAALDDIREKVPCTDLNFEEVNSKFCGILTRHCGKLVGVNPHKLRAIYACTCYDLLRGRKMSKIGYISEILGQTQASSANCYQRIELTEKAKRWIPEGDEPEEEAEVVKPKKLEWTEDWEEYSVPQQKRLSELIEFLEYRKIISVGILKRHYGGSTEIWSKIIQKNAERIAEWNESLRKH